MAWLQKRGTVWWIGYYVGREMIRKSLHTKDEAAAKRELEKANALVAARQSGAALEPLYEALSGKNLPKTTLDEEIKLWLNEAKRSTAANTFIRYSATANSLLASIPRETLLRDISSRQIQEHLDARFDATSPSTANLERKILRIFFKRVTDAGLLKVNPIVLVKHFRTGLKKHRKPFEIGQLSALYALATPFWQYMLLAGFYSGQRMGDCVTLEVEHVDFNGLMIRREMGKTNKLVQVPLTPRLAAAIRAQIGKRKSGDAWPSEANLYREHGAKPFSNQFRDLLAKAGLVEKRGSSKRRGKGGYGKCDFSFHSLRHSFVTSLKATGATQAVAKALAGHSSDAISDLYTHMPAEALSEAVSKLPEFVK